MLCKFAFLLALLAITGECSCSYNSTRLNSACTRADQCGSNAFCNPQSQCECDLGYHAAADGINCLPIICNSSAYCHDVIGTGTKCYQNRCLCDDSFKLDNRTQTCVPTKQPLNAVCTHGYQCGANAVCSAKDVCICQFGYTPSTSNNINCDYYQCQKDQDCSRFSIHAECFSSAFCTCNSTSGWVLDAGTQTCISHFKPLNGNCTADANCGQGAVCGDGHCRCQLGFLPDVTGGINCLQDRCTSALDCVRFDIHATCHSGGCQCDQANGWRLVQHNQTCGPRSTLLGGECLSDRQCGLNAACIDNTCQCDMGCLPMANRMDCSLKHCSNNHDCTVLDVDSRCDGTICVCKDGFYVDLDTQTCVTVGLGGTYFLEVFTTVVVITLIATVGVVMIMFVCRGARRRAEYLQKY